MVLFSVAVEHRHIMIGLWVLQYRPVSGIVLGGCISVSVLHRLSYLCGETDSSVVLLPLGMVPSSHYDDSGGGGYGSTSLNFLCCAAI